MARKFLTPIDLSGLELLNALAQNLPGPPAHGPGRFYFDTTLGQLGVSDGAQWAYFGDNALDADGVRAVVAAMVEGNTETGIAVTYLNEKLHFSVAVATDGTAGIVELATVAETSALTAADRAVTPASLAALIGTLVTDAELPGIITATRLDQFAAPTAALNLNGQRLTNVGAPTADADAATKAYVDATAQGLDVKASVRAATTADVTLSGTQTIDGVALVAGDRVLVKNQAIDHQNGIYVVATEAWTRSTDMDTGPEASPGSFVFVEEGVANADTGWVLTTDGVVTLGATALTFTQFSGAGSVGAGAGLTRTGTTLDVGQGDGIIVTADTVAIDTAVVTRKVAASIGDGTATAFVITHNLGTRDIQVQLYINGSTYETVEADVERTSVNTVTVRFAVAPAVGAYRVTVQG